MAFLQLLAICSYVYIHYDYNNNDDNYGIYYNNNYYTVY